MSFLHKVNFIALKELDMKEANAEANKSITYPTPRIQRNVFVDLWCNYSTKMFENFKAGIYEMPVINVKKSKTGDVINISTDLVIKLEPEMIAQGASGEIFRASCLKGPYSELIIKRNKYGSSTLKGDFIEALIHTILFCDQQAKGSYMLTEMASSLQIPTPFIPRLVYVFMSDTKDKFKSNTYTVMEHLNETLHSFVMRPDIDRATIISCLKQVCILLEYLQTKFEFMHRDLHSANVMVHYGDFSNGHDGSARVALIDFGLSRLKAPVKPTGENIELGFPSSLKAPVRRTRGQDIAPGLTDSTSMYDITHHYLDKNDFNSTLDLVMLFSSLYANSTFHGIVPEIYDIFLEPVHRNLKRNNDSTWKPLRNAYNRWNGDDSKLMVDHMENLHFIFYDNGVNIDFEGCNPKEALKLLRKLK